jgi:hypothetical protein
MEESMSRSGYSDDYCDDGNAGYLYRGAVESAIRGRRGQAFLKEMLAALDALPEKKLIAGELVEQDGAVCAMGAVAKVRGLDMKGIDPEDAEKVALTFGIAEAMAREVAFENDDDWGASSTETPEHRFQRMHKWVESQIRR